MAHKVFICHSSKDKMVADAACAAIEAHRISCWIAPRDILAGDEYGNAIIEALSSCEIVLVIFSRHVNESPQCRREIERAVSKERIIVPFRIEDILPSGSLEYALSNTHWLDAITPPLEGRLNELAETIGHILQRREGGVAPQRVAPSVRAASVAPVETKRTSGRVAPAIMGAAAVLVVAAAGITGVLLYRGKAQPPAEPVKQPVVLNTPAPQTTPPPPARTVAQPRTTPLVQHSAPPIETAKVVPEVLTHPPPPPPPPAVPVLTAEQKARLDQIGIKIEQLSDSAESTNKSLNDLAQRMQRGGSTINGKWTDLQTGMNNSLARAREALKAQDADRAERYANVADSDLGQIKTFLGR